MQKRAFQSPNGQRTCPKYGSELETRISTEKINLQFKPSGVRDAYSHNMLRNSFKDLETGLLRVKNRETEAEIHSKDLAAFSESINKSPLQEDSADGRSKHDTYKRQDNGKGSKRKVGEMDRKAASVETRSGKKIEQDWRIVRVSQLIGGKDRHSKVLTAKGLRDRRVRLSVPTAIQLYDLQDRLGLDQPSMAVDWLIKAAKSAIDELTVLDTEMASASVGNTVQLTSSDCSTVEHCVGSPRETAASALSSFTVGQGTTSHKSTNGRIISITTLKESDLGRSNSSTSDGSVRGSAEYTSNCSMSKPDPKIEARFKARERARKKSASAKNSGAPPPAIAQLNSVQPSLSSMCKSVSPYTTLPLEYQTFSKNDNLCGFQPHVLTGTDSGQQLCDYNASFYTQILCTQDFHPLQNMASPLTAALQKSFPPVPSTSSVHAVMESSFFQSNEMADSTNPIFEPSQNRQLGGNAAQGQANLLYSNIPMFMKNVEQHQQQQQAQTHFRYFPSTAVPTFSNDINFSTSILSSRGPLQSNSSSITNMPSISQTRKNASGDASIKAAHFVPFQSYDSHTVFPAIHSAGQRKA